MTETEQTESDFPEAWKPQDEGAERQIAGKVVSVTLSPDFGYGPYPIVTLDVNGTERAVHAFHQVLRSELARRKPRKGDDLEIKYLGQRTPKSGNRPFHAYRVTGGTEPEFNWDAELPEHERPVEPDVPIPQVEAPQQQTASVPFEDDVPFRWCPGSWDKATNHNPFVR